MNILAINGSYHGQIGYTSFLIQKVFDGAATAGADCEVIHLAEKKVRRCQACGFCHTEEHYLQCAFQQKDDVASIFEKIRHADLIIYATPIYVFGISALLKTFIDRFYSTGDIFDLSLSESGLLFHHIDRSINSKPFVTLITCDNLEAETPKNVLAYFKTYAKFMDAAIVGTLVRNGGRLSGHGKNPEREKRVPKLHQVYAAYEQAGFELAKQGKINRKTQRKANQEIIPVPFFNIMKRLPFKPIKKKMIEKAREMNS
ncbi:MAG: flavodoxin family protein [Anaerolineaceae bacterium]|nr:flavodoxin family protein [Anaerolineaceae bacterium]